MAAWPAFFLMEKVYPPSAGISSGQLYRFAVIVHEQLGNGSG
jgi:hypothetical protein